MKNIIALTICIVLALTISSCLTNNSNHIQNKLRKTVLAIDGRSLMPIIISKNADSEVQVIAKELANLLNKISNAKFEIKTGNGTTGIAVGTIKDFPQIKFQPKFNILNPGERQGYEIKSHGNGIYLIGATPQAVGYAVYDLLYKLGYRAYFPMKRWTIIPHKKRLELSVNVREIPDYYTRNIWPGWNYWHEFRAAAAPWNRANRGGGYRMNSGHAYNHIIRKNKKAFDTHPEYYGLLNGKRTSTKLCISNPGLRKLVEDYAITVFEKDPTLDSISMDPSDGGGWCECEKCKKLGPPSDRALTLANDVAKAVDKKFTGKRVGIYAYSFHSPPPSFNVDPNVVVSVTTSFIRGGYTLNEIMAGWQKKKATLGIREYYDVFLWSHNSPGASRGGNIGYLKKTIPEFYHKGVRYLSSESNDALATNGLGHYLALRMMWDIEEVNKIDILMDEFFQNCFGPAATIMKDFYKLLDGTNRRPLCPDLIGRMYRLLDKAKKRAVGQPDILSRIDDFVLYTRYCELLMAYFQDDKKSGNTVANLMRFSARIKNSRMVHSLAILRRLKNKLPKKSAVIDWKNSNPVTCNEIEQLIINGIKNNKLLNFTPISFGDNLVPFPQRSKQTFQYGKTNRGRGKREFFTWADSVLKPIKLTITGGLIKHYRDRGNVKVKLYKIGGESDDGTRETLIQSDATVPPDGKKRIVTLTPRQEGLHKIVINDGRDATLVNWDKGTLMTMRAEIAKPLKINGTFYFYVPKGTKTLGFFCDMHRGSILSPDKKQQLKFLKTLGFYSIEIPKGMDGKLWQLKKALGEIALMTVPPYLALAPSELLLPQNIIKKDDKK